jgi:hypothetical protein
MAGKMSQRDASRISRLQERINLALRETPEDRRKSNYSDYRPDNIPKLVAELTEAAAQGGAEGIEAALDEFDRLAEREDKIRAQRTLMHFLIRHPAAAELGLRVPSLEERNPWKVLPSKRNP